MGLGATLRRPFTTLSTTASSFVSSFAAIIEARFGSRDEIGGAAVGQYWGAKGHSNSGE